MKNDARDPDPNRRSLHSPGVVLGDDWIDVQPLQPVLRRRGLFDLRRSPIARKIITFNLIAMIALVAGVLFLNSSRDSLVYQRATGLATETRLIGDVIEAVLNGADQSSLLQLRDLLAETLAGLRLRGGIEVSVFAPSGVLVTSITAPITERDQADLDAQVGRTLVTDFLAQMTAAMARLVGPDSAPADAGFLPVVSRETIATVARDGGSQLSVSRNDGNTIFAVTAALETAGMPSGVITVATAAGEVDRLVRREREDVFRVFFVGIVISVVLSLVLASTIANPLADLAAAAEVSDRKNARKMAAARVRIPDLTARPDEIGRLSGALRGMVAALYDRIESNEQFAADVAHEIKNPLASLRSAVGTMRVARRAEQREQMLAIIEHDVKRLDRLVSDISNASRLDGELVKEQEETFDLTNLLRNLASFLSRDADSKGIDFVSDIPQGPIMVQGLEGRLAQVFVNIVTNAISFCEDGDGIRIWARARDGRMLVVVEDSGPGIPEEALKRIFARFYSSRPTGQFGNNSGLGLAISKQIVEAHGGVIWAENIRPTDADPTSTPAGARFVVGLPL